MLIKAGKENVMLKNIKRSLKEQRIDELAKEFPALIDKADGLGHLAAIHFRSV